MTAQLIGFGFLTVALAVLVLWLCRCRHPELRREVRTGKGKRDVLYYVCDRCGYAVPAIQRTPSDLAKAKRLKQQVTTRPENVADIRDKRSPSA